MGGIQQLLGSDDLTRLATDLNLTCLDVGARRGFTEDLLPIASIVDAVGFDADEEECRRLNAVTEKVPWRTLRAIPAALGREADVATLHLYRQRGCSSFLEADLKRAQSYSRGHYYELDGTLDLKLQRLDDVAEKHGLADAAYLKIDVQGYELEVLGAAEKLLASSLLAIRAEVSFVPLYKDQPLYEDLAQFLRRFGFVPMGFQELHEWRHTTLTKHPTRAPGIFPYSRGQLVHGDMLFMKDLEHHLGCSTTDVIKAGYLALAYGYVDYAKALFELDHVRNEIGDRSQINVVRGLADASNYLARAQRSDRFSKLFGAFKNRLRAQWSTD